MKLIECYVENFGRLSKQKYSFKDGLNCITEDNGSGKTTLATFIKVMLYGMSDTKKTSLDENDRKHYLPWQGGTCGGSLTFSAGGKIYRVERTFAPKASDDTCVVYDTQSGRATTDFSEGLGEVMFGIDADGFERTVFLSERALTPKSDNKSISAKLSDLVGCDGDIGEMDDAMKALDEQRKFYYKKGGAGVISDTKEKIDEVTRRLDSLKSTEVAIEENHAKMREITAKIQAARMVAKELLKQREEAVLRSAETNYEKQYKEMGASVEENQRRRTLVGEIFGADIPSFLDIDEASYKSVEAKRLMQDATDTPEIRQFRELSARFDGKVERGQIEEARVAISALTAQKKKVDDPRLIKAKKIFSGRVPESEELDRIEELINNKKVKAPVGCIIGYVLSLICLILGFVIDPMLIAVGAIGIILSLIAHIAITGRSKAKRKAEIYNFFGRVSSAEVNSDEEATARLKDMRELLPIINNEGDRLETERLYEVLKRLTDLFSTLYPYDILVAADKIIRDYDTYAEGAVAERYMQGDRSARLERAKKLQEESDAFVKRFRTKTSDPFTELRTALTEYERLTAELVAKRDEMARLESLNTIGEGNQKKAAMDLAAIDQKRHENDMLMADLSREYALTERLYNSQIEELEGREELSMRKAELEEQLAKHTDNYNTVVLTKNYLTAAKDNMTFKYLGKTKAGFISYAEKIGGITGESFEMDTDFGVTKVEGGASKRIEAYSRGTRDLFNLAARLAIVDSLYEKEYPFILLDDPFTSFDDKKTAAAIRLLHEIGKEKQIIYFTCSKSRSI